MLFVPFVFIVALYVKMVRAPASRKKKPLDDSTTKTVRVVDAKYVPQIEHYEQYFHKPAFDDEPYDFSDYLVEYCNTFSQEI